MPVEATTLFIVACHGTQPPRGCQGRVSGRSAAGFTAASTVALARRLGWTVTGTRNLCPDCQADEEGA